MTHHQAYEHTNTKATRHTYVPQQGQRVKEKENRMSHFTMRNVCPTMRSRTSLETQTNILKIPQLFSLSTQAKGIH